MISPTRTFRWPTTGHTLFIVLMLTGIASADDNLRVLPIENDDGPTKRMLSRYLKQQAYEALDRRREAYEKIKTRQQAEAYQQRLRATFIEHLGGFPKRTP